MSVLAFVFAKMITIAIVFVEMSNAATSVLPPPPAMPAIAVSCGCGMVHTWLDWLSLPLCGLQDDGAGGTITLRNCPCKSTRAVDTAEEQAARRALFLDGEMSVWAPAVWP